MALEKNISMRALFFIFSVIFALYATGTAEGSGQLLCDSGFENSVANGTFPSSGCWHPSSAGGGAYAGVTTTSKHSDNNGLWIYTGNESYAWWSRPYQEFIAAPGQIYSGDAWIRTPQGWDWVNGSSANVRIEFLNASRIILTAKNSDSVSEPNANWANYSVASDPAPSGTSFVRFMCNIEKPDGSLGQSIANFDDTFFELTLNNNPPNTPSSPSPAIGVSNVSTTATLNWSGGDPDSGDTVTYDVYFGTNSNPGKVSSSQSSTNYNPGTLAYSTTYYWKIVARDNHGAETAGAVWSFTSGSQPNNAPNVPSSPSPADGASNVSTTATLNWSGGDPDSGDTVTYDVYFGTNSNPGKVSSSQSSTNYNPGTLAYSTNYYWKIIASDNHGAETSGPICSFITGSQPNNAPNVPSSPSPANGASNVSATATLSWNGGDPDSGDTVTYDVYFGTSSNPGKVSSNQSSTNYTPGTLSPSSTYYWKIIAKDNYGAETTGAVWSFTTTATADSSVVRAYEHLYEVMDKYHNSFDVYTDQDAGGNHYIPSGWMGDWQDISFNGNSMVNPHSGTTSLEIKYSAQGTQENKWTGIYFQYPENNWGDKEGGYDLTGATKLTFWARGKNGGEKGEFKVGGINRLPYHDPQKPYQDSVGPLSTGIITLTSDWKQYTIDLINPEYFAIYTDKDAGGNNHYIPSGWYNGGGNMTFDDAWTDNPHSGSSCIKILWNGGAGTDGSKWNGIVWQQPENNWTGGSGKGFDLTDATKLKFWARTDQPGLKLKFLVGYPSDSSGEVLINQDGWVEVNTNWTQYEIDLSGRDLSDISAGFAFAFNDKNDPDPDGFTFYLDDIVFDKVIDKDLSHVIGGFCWVTDQKSNPAGATIYLDDIKYDKERSAELRFLNSYVVTSASEDVSSKNAAHIYDNALAMLAFMARGTAEDWKRAKVLADSFVYCQNHDRYFNDGRLRNVYMSGDIMDQQTGNCRLPGWWDYEKEQWLEDKYQVSTYTGNLAWVIIALLQYYEEQGGQEYLDSAVTLGTWVNDHCYNSKKYKGYEGGYIGWEPSDENPQGQTKIQWKSSEHNLDVFVAFSKLYKITGDSAWEKRANSARSFVKSMWSKSEGHFWTGTSEAGDINNGEVPEDVQSWALMALGDAKYIPGVRWVEGNCLVDNSVCAMSSEYPSFAGFDFNTDRDGVWFEGTAHMCIAYQILGENEKANIYLSEIRKAQTSAKNNNQKGIVATCRDELTTGFTSICEDPAYPNGECPWFYYNRLHIGATAWYLFAEERYNPYWGVSIPNITVSSPNGGETWLSGTTQTINWTYSGDQGESVKIELLKNGQVVRTIAKKTSIGSNGSGLYQWKIPSKQKSGTDYTIRLTNKTNTMVKDVSNNTFAISKGQ